MRLSAHPHGLRVRQRLCGLALPRLERAYLSSYTFDLSVASAQACLSAAASGMMVLTGIVFAMVQFSAIAYSPRLVLWFARITRCFIRSGPSPPRSCTRTSRSHGSIAADPEDKVKALQEDPQGLGLSRRRPDTLFVPMSAGTV